jgi:hypothetical protein
MINLSAKIVSYKETVIYVLRWLFAGMLHCVVWYKLTVVSEVLTASTHLPVDEAASTSETLVNFYQTTRRYNPEDSHLHAGRRENLKSHNSFDRFQLYLYFKQDHFFDL